MSHFVAVLVAPVATFALLASPALADEIGTPANPIEGGLCIRPGSNPPLQLPCSDPLATVPYVTAPPVDVGNGGSAEDPTHVLVLSDGQCALDRVNPPMFVPCPAAALVAAATASSPAARHPKRQQATTTTTTTVVAAVPVASTLFVELPPFADAYAIPTSTQEEP
jgi:hypothetical protein